MDAWRRVMWLRYRPEHDLRRLPWPSVVYPGFPLTLQNYADENFNGYGYFYACLYWSGQGSASDLTS